MSSDSSDQDPFSSLSVPQMDMNQVNSPDTNTSFGIDNDPLFHVCWRRQDCRWCLQGDVPCSWCAVTSTCVPNPARLPILAPLSSSQICPLGSKERWELRALPFGCHVSTITFLTAAGSVLGTLLALGLGIVVVWAARRVPGWWGRRKLVGRGRWRERIWGLGNGVGVGVGRGRGRGRGRRRARDLEGEGFDREELGDGDGGGNGPEDAERRPLLGRDRL